MEVLFEDRSTYDPRIEAIAIATLTVECHPGQVRSIKDYLANIGTQAGVYHAAFDSIEIPAPEPAAALVAEPVAVPTADVEILAASPAADEQPATDAHSSIEPSQEDSGAPAAEPVQGATDGESTIQPEHLEPQTAGDGQGSKTPEGGTAEVGTPDAGSQVPGPAGAGAEAGSVGGSA